MGTSRIAERFARLKGRGEGALITYLMAGDPDLKRTLEYLFAMAEGGADLIELGVPFSDPVADGPTIQAAGLRALASGTTPEQVLEIAGQLRRQSEIPLALMGYYNLIFRLGEAEFIARATAVGVDGLIIPDLPLEEAESLLAAAQAQDIAVILLATPESSDGRIEKIAQETSGFLYLVVRYGTTGAREKMAAETKPLIKKVRSLIPEGLPLAVGFGLARPEHIRAVIRAGADGAVVGSRIVAEIAKGAAPRALESFVRELKKGTSIQR
ncbi:MAG: tryptophan synthase subunit alpha [Candidatus Bipolaricaulia bacterium]